MPTLLGSGREPRHLRPKKDMKVSNKGPHQPYLEGFVGAAHAGDTVVGMVPTQLTEVTHRSSAKLTVHVYSLCLVLRAHQNLGKKPRVTGWLESGLHHLHGNQRESAYQKVPTKICFMKLLNGAKSYHKGYSACHTSCWSQPHMTPSPGYQRSLLSRVREGPTSLHTNSRAPLDMTSNSYTN